MHTGSQPKPVGTPIDRPTFKLASECAVELWLGILGHRWNALILYHLSLEPQRFGGLLGCLPAITSKVLAERLVELRRRGLVERADAAGSRCYRLTHPGRALMPILDALGAWARDAGLQSELSSGGRWMHDGAWPT